MYLNRCQNHNHAYDAPFHGMKHGYVLCISYALQERMVLKFQISNRYIKLVYTVY